ncbi:MAG: DUF6402 family protein [Azoarcus sp.]|nr:DUF6402 family protein [Azoarcus sp.]
MSGYDRPGRDLCENLNTRILALPGIMRQQYWRVSALLMERWLNMLANSFPEQGVHDATTVRMDWVLGFVQAYHVYATAKANKVWVNKAAQDKIKEKLIDRKAVCPKRLVSV